MKLLKFIVVFLLIVSLVNAGELNSYEKIKAGIELNSGINLELLPGYRLDYLTINLSFMPKNDYLQKVSNTFYSNPEGELISPGTWKYTKAENSIDYGVNSVVDSNIKVYKIKNKIEFPYDYSGLEQYLESTENINSDDSRIIEKANELASGNNDLYEVVALTGEWVNANINYNLTTLTENVNQNASWTFENRYGVCDEITTLFISMLRSVGIPAKFVSGIAYTDQINGFGSHAWAEVYFPEIGWVPFDVTYGQYGYVDSTHVKMRESIDPSEPSVTYQWRANNVKIDAKEMNVNASFLEKGNVYDEKVNVKLSLPETEYKFNSYIPVVVELENLEDYYKVYSLYLSKTPTIINESRKDVLLKPFERKYASFLIPVENGDRGYIYTSLIEINNFFGKSYNETIKYSDEYSLFSKEDALNYINGFVVVSEKDYTKQARLICNKTKFYTYEEVSLNCVIENRGNSVLNNLNICLLQECHNLNLNILEKKQISFKPKLNLGENNFEININSLDISAKQPIKLKLLGEPVFNVYSSKYDSIVNYTGNYEIILRINAEDIKNLKIISDGKIIANLAGIKRSAEIKMPFEGGFFYGNSGELLFEYSDENNVNYSKLMQVDIKVVNVPLLRNKDFLISIGIVLILII